MAVNTDLHLNHALGDSSLKEQLDARRHHAEEKLIERKRSHPELFEEGDEVLEKIFGSLTGWFHKTLSLAFLYIHLSNYT